MGSPATFWPEALPWAQQAHAQTGVLTSVILSQWAIETEYGGADWSPNCNPGNVGSFDGQPVARFPNLAEGVAAYIQLMNAPNRPQFGATIRKASTYQQQAYLLGAANPVWASARYALPGGAPGSEIVSIINTYRLTKYDGAAPPQPVPAPPAPLPVSTFGEGPMIAPTPSGNGFWQLKSDGSVLTHGDAQYLGGPNTSPANGQLYGGPPVLPAGESCVSIAAHPTTQGYWIESNVGNIYAYGAAPYEK